MFAKRVRRVGLSSLHACTSACKRVLVGGSDGYLCSTVRKVSATRKRKDQGQTGTPRHRPRVALRGSCALGSRSSRSKTRTHSWPGSACQHRASALVPASVACHLQVQGTDSG